MLRVKPVDKKSKNDRDKRVPALAQRHPSQKITHNAKTPVVSVKKNEPSVIQGPSHKVITLAAADQRAENPAALQILVHMVGTAFDSAEKIGIKRRDFLELISANERPRIEDQAGLGYATPEEGLAVLLEAEGGCVEINQARKLYHQPHGVSRQAMSERIAAGDVIAYKTGSGRWVLPRWQFRPEGGLLAGLPDVLKKIRAEIPTYGQLFPFAFFLQADPICHGQTPLQCLRNGDMKTVLLAVDGHKG